MRKTTSNPATVAPPLAAYSHSVRVDLGGGVLIFVSGQVPVGTDGALVGEGDAAAQTEQVITNLASVLSAEGASLREVVSTTTYLARMSDLATVNQVRERHFPHESPTSTTIAVAALARPQWLVEIDGVAVLA